MTHKRLQGQTLIEVLTTIVFIVISVLALVRFQNYLTYDNSLMNERSVATLLASSQLETLRDYHVLSTTTGYTAYSSIASGSSTQTYQTTTFTIAWTVTSYLYPSYKTINVSVSWMDRRGTTQSVQLSSNVASIEPAYSSEIM